jgi:hypothetical protein
MLLFTVLVSTAHISPTVKALKKMVLEKDEPAEAITIGLLT